MAQDDVILDQNQQYHAFKLCGNRTIVYENNEVSYEIDDAGFYTKSRAAYAAMWSEVYESNGESFLENDVFQLTEKKTRAIIFKNWGTTYVRMRALEVGGFFNPHTYRPDIFDVVVPPGEVLVRQLGVGLQDGILIETLDGLLGLDAAFFLDETDGQPTNLLEDSMVEVIFINAVPAVLEP